MAVFMAFLPICIDAYPSPGSRPKLDIPPPIPTSMRPSLPPLPTSPTRLPGTPDATCMYMHVYASRNVWVHVYLGACMCMHVRVHAEHVIMSVHVDLCTYIHVNIGMHGHIHVVGSTR